MKISERIKSIDIGTIIAFFCMLLFLFIAIIFTRKYGISCVIILAISAVVLHLFVYLFEKRLGIYEPKYI